MYTDSASISELINIRRKLDRDVACLAAEGALFQRTVRLWPKLLVRGKGIGSLFSESHKL